MKTSLTRWPAAALALFLALPFLAEAPATAQDSSQEARPIGFHVVRPGDTLESLSQRYSGGSQFWRENWALNPDIKNPNFLAPGQRVRVLLSSDVPPASARIVKVSRQVEKKPTPQPWDRAEIDDLLRDQDGMRTGREGAYEMRFTDGTSMSVAEESLIFLRRFGNALQGVSRDEIEIVEGQADLSGQAVTTPSDIEIVVGSARAQPRPDNAGTIQTRIRKADAGTAQLMVYEGESEVEAAGTTVAVDAGMGTSVPEGEPPTPPEKLLAAPKAVAPTAGSSFAFSNPEFSWGAVADAASYKVEVCRDPECLEATGRYPGIDRPRWRPERLPVGGLYWRVTAVAASGLDGFPSETVAFQVTAPPPDREPPSVQIGLSGLYIRYGSDLVLGPFSRFETQVVDMQSGVGEWEYLLDGQPVSRDKWYGPWDTGVHKAEARVSDKAGNVAQVGPIDFKGDPDPPLLDWRTGGASMVEAGGLPGWQSEPLTRRRAKKLRRAGVLLEYSSDGARWLPIRLPVDAGGRWTASAPRVEIGSVRADRARIFLRAPLDNPFGQESPIQLSQGELLEVRSEDQGSGVGTLTFGLADDGTSYQLWFEATDLVGNRRTLQVPVSRPTR